MLDTFRQDFSYAVRGLRNRPGFAAAMILTLGLGIGANAAMFSIVDRMLFRPPPLLHDPSTSHLVYITRTRRGVEYQENYVQYARYLDITRWTHSFARTAQFTTRELAIGGGTDAREMQVGIVSGSFFGFFDAPPAIGRYFTPDEDAVPSGTPVAVLSNGYWQTQYGGRRDVLGSTIRIGALVYTIIGVAPARFAGLWPDHPPVAFIPITSYGSTMPFTHKGQTWYNTYNQTFSQIMAQRKPGVTEAAANADLTNALQRSYQVQYSTAPVPPPADLSKRHAFVGSILSERGPNESSLAKVATWISGVALIVLLIACANVANLLLTRALSRRREIAVRLALGMSRARLLSQLLTESLLLAVLGAAAGLVLAQVGGAILRAEFIPDSTSASVMSDSRTLIFTSLAALFGGLLTGLTPVLQIRRANLTRDLKAGVREGTYYRSDLRVGLLVMQGALSVVLLVGAGLFVRSLDNVRAVRLGYDVDPVLLVNLNMRGFQIDTVQKALLRRRLVQAASVIPEVQSASLQTSVPFWSTWAHPLHVAGIDSVGILGQFYLNAVGPDYFATLGTRIVRGRGIADHDVREAPGAMVVSVSMAKALWPSADPIGQCVKISEKTAPCTYVIGVAEDIKEQSLSKDAGLFYYLSAAQFHPDEGGLFVRTRDAEASRVAEAIRRKLQPVMPGASYVTVTPFKDIIGSQTQSWKMGATMFLAFGMLALVLAAIGLFSVISYNVAQRTHELGVRVALGAQISDLVRLVVGEGVRFGAAGVAIGAAIALASGRWVAPLLFNVSPRDPAVFALVAAVLLTVAAVASFIPARRASRIDPNRALRSD